LNKIGFVFPGQGAQYVGMGKALYENHISVKRTFDMASEALEQNIADLCFAGSDDELKRTENTQPAILTLSVAIARLLENNGISPSMVAGLSLGEYSSLVCADAIDFVDAMKLVRKRAILIQEAMPLGVGGMGVVVGLTSLQVKECCNLASDKTIVEISNYNSPNQFTISGHIEAVEKALFLAKQMGAKQTVKLQVSAPFHSRLLDNAGESFFSSLMDIEYRKFKVPVLSNVTAKPYTDVNEIPKLLKSQISQPVLWEDCVKYMLSSGISTFVEVGPGKVLSGLIRKISKSACVYSIDEEDSLKSTIEILARGVA